MIWVHVYGGRGRSKQRLHMTLKLAALTHTHTHTQTKSYAWWKNIYLKHVRILENVVNICIINDPATHLQIIRMHFFIRLPDPRIIHSARGYNRHPRITTAHSAQISTASLGCKVAKLREFVCVDCVRRMLFIQDLQPDNLGIYWLDYSYNEV